MKVAISGCANGEIDRIYDSVRRVQEKHGITIDLLIVCGDFQALRDEEDLEGLNCNEKYKTMGNFHRYYKGEAKAPVLTLFVSGMREAPNLFRELHYGGWVAPNMYWMGYAGVVRVGPLKIAGLSGFFKGQDYFRGHYEFPPYNDSSARSSYAVRDWDVARLDALAEPVDIVVSYDWPRCIWKHGDFKELLAREELEGKDSRREMEGNTFGSPAAMDLLQKLRPGFWFAGFLHLKFAALVPHKDGTFTRFLALDRCQRGRDFLQVLDIDPTSQSFLQRLPQLRSGRSWGADSWRHGAATKSPFLSQDPEWLAIQKVNHENLSFSYKSQKVSIKKPTREDVAWVIKRLREKWGSKSRTPANSKRHNLLLPLSLRERGGGKDGFGDLNTGQLRELFETRGLEFFGHLDKASLVRKILEHDELFAAERNAQRQGEDEAFPYPPDLFKAERTNAAAQRRVILELLELEDIWAQHEAELRRHQKDQDQDKDYDPFSEAPAPHVAPGGTGEAGDAVPSGVVAGGDGDRDDEESDDDGEGQKNQRGADEGQAGVPASASRLQDDGAGDDEDDIGPPGYTDAQVSANDDSAPKSVTPPRADDGAVAEDAEGTGAANDAIAEDACFEADVPAVTDPYAALFDNMMADEDDQEEGDRCEEQAEQPWKVRRVEEDAYM
eukprot:TRINITY_DN56292_c0_g1_i1.p1 TRINITY_DN56292_c0_g1~~TRINITY_DN56292_c0_g1_i1.p1  ORF type:complete len:667 (-),score=127.36 TRINITY_DN56292_c0_g1_i1:15-2015(-)